MDLTAMIALAGSVITILAVLTGWLGTVYGWWESPERKAERERQKAMADALLGEAPVFDRSGQVIDHGQPGLVARTATLEEAVKLLVDQRVELNDIRTELMTHAGQISEHDAAIAGLIAATFKSGADSALAAEVVKRMTTIDGETQ